MSLRDELERIYEEQGRLTPPLVLEEARDPESPLHTWFEWDDSEAAEKWRLEQARELIRKIRIRYVDASGGPSSVRRYHALRASDEVEFEYFDQDDIRKNPLQRKLLLRQMERDVSQLVARYEGLQEFWGLLRKVRRKKAQ